MRWCVLVCVVISSTVYIIPVSSTDGKERDLFECCPCERNSESDSAIDSPSPMSDGCPCGERAADSESESSFLVPSAIRAMRPTVSTGQRKEDSTHILQPEVEFASSFLNTLKEATDEEYKEALARDAARSVARAANIDNDAETKENNNELVTIIVNPNPSQNPVDDILRTEESRAHETRCVNPQKNSLSKGKSFRNMFNLDSFAEPSNIQEKIADKSIHLSRLNLNNNNPELNLNHDVIEDYELLQPGIRFELSNNERETNTENVNKNNGLFNLGNAVLKGLQNTIKLRDIELLPKSFLEKEVSPLSKYFTNKLGRLNKSSNMKKKYLNGLLGSESDLSNSANNLQDQNKGSTFYSLQDKIPESRRQDVLFSEESKNTKPNTSEVKLLSPLFIREDKNQQKLLTNKEFSTHSSEMDFKDNGAAATSGNELIASLIDSDIMNEATSIEKGATPLNQNSLSTINLLRLGEVLQTLNLSPILNFTNKATKPIETSTTNAMDNEILNTIPGPSEMWMNAEGNENLQRGNSETVCIVDAENRPENKIENSIEITAKPLNDGLNNEEALNNEQQHFSENRNASTSIHELNTEMPQVFTSSRNHILVDSSVGESMNKNIIFEQLSDLSTTSRREDGEATTTVPDSMDTQTRLNNINDDVIITAANPRDNIYNDNSQTNSAEDVVFTLPRSTESTTPTSLELDGFKTTDKPLTYSDLQRMSDLLLNKNNEQSNNQKETITSSTRNTDENANDYNNFKTQQSQKVNPFNSPRNSVERNCLNETFKITHERSDKEMAVDASEKLEVGHMTDKNYQLRQDNILQPFHGNGLPSLLQKNAEGSSNANTPLLNDLKQIADLLARSPSSKDVKAITIGNDLASAMSKPQKSTIYPSIRLDDIDKSFGWIKSKLALPETLELKPLPSKKSKTLRDILNLPRDYGIGKNVGEYSNIGSTVKLLDLEDLKAKVKDNFQQLLHGEKTKNTIIQDISPFDSLGLTEKFQSHTEDAVLNIQNSLGSVFKPAKDSTNVLSKSFTQPGDFLTELSQKHEDLKDKLEGIRFDLNDRLASFHEDVLEKSKFALPVLPSENIMIVRPKITKPSIKAGKQNKQNRPLQAKLASESSNNIPKTMAPPRLKPPTNLQNIKPSQLEKSASNTDVQETPIMSKQLKPLASAPHTLRRLQNLRALNVEPEKPKQTQIKITYASTTIKPMSKEIQKPKSSLSSNLDSNLLKTKMKDLKAARFFNKSPTDMKPVKSNLNIQPPKERSFVNDNKHVPENNLKKAFTIPNMPSPKELNGSDLLNKIKNAFKARLIKKDKATSSGLKQADDMAKAASNNVAEQTINEPEAIKQNTIYNCRMMCSKE